MKDLIISMESTSDISSEFIEKYDIEVVHMDYFIDEEMFNTKESDVDASGIYEKMKKGAKTSTSQINEANYEEFFRELLTSFVVATELLLIFNDETSKLTLPNESISNVRLPFPFVTDNCLASM